MMKEAMDISIDLVINAEADTLCGTLGLSSHVYEKKPDNCPDCRCIKFRSYELLGAESSPIIWECKKCHHRFPKYRLAKMEKILKTVKHLWTNPNDWTHVNKEDYN